VWIIWNYLRVVALISAYIGIPWLWNSITRQLLLEKEKDQKYTTQMLHWRSKHLKQITRTSSVEEFSLETVLPKTKTKFNTVHGAQNQLKSSS